MPAPVYRRGSRSGCTDPSRLSAGDQVVQLLFPSSRTQCDFAKVNDEVT